MLERIFNNFISDITCKEVLEKSNREITHYMWPYLQKGGILRGKCRRPWLDITCNALCLHRACNICHSWAYTEKNVVSLCAVLPKNENNWQHMFLLMITFVMQCYHKYYHRPDSWSSFTLFVPQKATFSRMMSHINL